MGGPSDTADEARSALSTAATGQLEPLNQLSSTLADRDDPEAAAWRAALMTERWLAGLEPHAPAFSGDAPPEAFAEMAVRLGKAAVLALDPENAQRLVEEAQARGPLPTGTRLRLDVVAGFARALRGDVLGLGELAQSTGEVARKEGVASVVVEVSALRALAELTEGALDQATASARRASRMARTEGMPQPEYIANIVLARVRRLSGRAHHALRILSALGEVAPPPFLPWLGWELTLSGGPDGYRQLPPHARDGPTAGSALARALDRVEDASSFRAALAGAKEMAPCRLALDDLAIVRGALDPTAPSPHPALTDWRAGAKDAPPLGVDGLVPTDTDDELSYVLFGAGNAARFLQPGIHLLSNQPLRVTPGRRKSGRVQSALPALALAGHDGIPEDEFFRRVYGFEFERELHHRTLNLLIHRMRTSLPAGVVITRDDGTLRLKSDGSLLIPDPRCARGIEERLLRMLARAGTSSAKEAAAALGVPLRSAQAALETLVTDGDCQRDRSGRSVGYRIEDTTFQEPTGLRKS